MFAANISRAEAQARSTQVRVESYDIVIDLDPRSTATPEQNFLSSTRVRFEALTAADTCVNLIADAVANATLDGQPLTIDDKTFDGEHLFFYVEPGEHELMVASTMRFSRTGEGLHRFVDPADDRVYLYSPVSYTHLDVYKRQVRTGDLAGTQG